MTQIKNEMQYKAACDRINELLKIVGNDTPADDKNMLELDLISDLVADYEEEHYPIAAPTLIETIKLRLYEMGITQTKLAEMLGLSTARVSEIMTGKSEPSLKIGREISKKLKLPKWKSVRACGIDLYTGDACKPKKASLLIRSSDKRSPSD